MSRAALWWALAGLCWRLPVGSHRAEKENQPEGVMVAVDVMGPEISAAFSWA